MSLKNRRPFNLDQHLQDLEEIYQQALRDKKFACAVKAKDMQTKLYEKYGGTKKGPLTLGDLSDEDIASLLEELAMLTKA